MPGSVRQDFLEDTKDGNGEVLRQVRDLLHVLLIYSGYTVPKSAQWTGSSGIWDREHLWPQSFGLIALNANSRARTDVFNLRPCDVSVNSSRGNKFYDETTPPGSSYPDAPLSSYDADSWEPRPEEKGLIARSMFYMALRYDGSDPDVPDLELSDTPNPALYRFGKLASLLAWHRQFSPTDAERARNQKVFTDYQHNRNPFIDHPEFADIVFSGASPAQAWRNVHFTATELANPALSGDAADLDGDGWRNLVEYALNRDPRLPEQTPVITSSFTVEGGSPFILLSFPHNRYATNTTIACEESSDLQNWHCTRGTCQRNRDELRDRADYNARTVLRFALFRAAAHHPTVKSLLVRRRSHSQKQPSKSANLGCGCELRKVLAAGAAGMSPHRQHTNQRAKG